MTQLVFVYGTLKQGHGNHKYYLMDNNAVQFRGDHVTNPNYTMVHLGGFPGVLDTGNTAITGEIYSITNTVFARLDRLEGYPSMYTRKEIETPYGNAWIYIYNTNRPESFNEFIVESGVWK